MCRLRTVDKGNAVARQAGGIGGDRKEREAVLVVGRSAGPRDDDQRIGRAALEDEGLGPGKPKTVARFFDRQGDMARVVLGGFVDGDTEHGLARDHAGKVASAQLVIGGVERGDAEHRSREEGRRGEVATDFLKHDARLYRPHAEAAIGFAREHPGKAHLAELAPQLMAEAILAFGVAPVAQLFGDIALTGHEVARDVAQHRLIVV